MVRLIQLALLAALLASGSVLAQPGSDEGATRSAPAAQQAPDGDSPDDKPAPDSADDAPQPSSPDVFRPSEEISEDLSVPFPTDI